MKITISRRYVLQSAHKLPNVPNGHKCGRTHGHTWAIEIHVTGEPDERGWFMDFADIDAVYRERVNADLDHGSLNDFIPNPTTENLCVEIARRLLPALPGLSRVVARENDHSAVELVL